jgi:hypothetical protein
MREIRKLCIFVIELAPEIIPNGKIIAGMISEHGLVLVNGQL